MLESMKKIHGFGLLACLFSTSWGLFSTTTARGADWLTMPSTYTHAPASGQRVEQFSQVEAPPLTDQSRRISSGYTHYRSTIQFGQSADNYHRVDEWGPPVRPYGEWRFPFRPYSSPYPNWGAPFAGFNAGININTTGGFPGGGIPGGGFPGGGFPGGGIQNPGFPGTGNPNFPGFPGGGGIPGQPFEPYPANPAGGYENPPWYDGSYPDVGAQRPLTDREFFRDPTGR